MTKTVLVTGARGYLGGRLITALERSGLYSLIGTSRTQAAPPAGWPPSVRLIALDPAAQDDDVLVAALAGVDAIVHLAAPNEIESANAPAQALQSGGVGTIKLLRAAGKAGVGRFVFLSTIHVYGAPLQGRITEATLPKPTHPYAIIHRTAEDFVLAAQAARQIEGVVLRLSNGIGAPAWKSVDRWTLIGNDLCRQAMEQGKVTLKSSGLQWRDFILLGDFVRAVECVLAAPAEKLGDGLFNLGGRLPLRMIDIAELIAERAAVLLGREVVVERPPAAPNEEYPSIDYAIDRMQALGFTPSPRAALTWEIDATLALCRRQVGA